MYSFTSRVRYSECDGNLTLSIPAAMNYLQDCSMFHCEHIGHGLAYCNDQGFAWLVAAWQIRFNRLPRYCEEIHMSTWCNEMTNTLARRTYTIEDGEGNRLVEAESLCAAVSTQTGKAMRIPDGEKEFLSDEPSLGLPPTKRKLRLTGNLEHVLDVPVTDHLIDSNGHVNNVQYVRVAEEAVRLQEPDFEPSRLLVQYKVPARLGDTLCVSLYQNENGYGVKLAGTTGHDFAIVCLERR